MPQLVASPSSGQVSLRRATPADALALAAGIQPDTFRHFMRLQPASAEVQHVAAYIEALNASPEIWPYTVRWRDEVVGMTCATHLRPEAGQYGIGLTWYFPSARRTAVNPAAKWLLLRDAFERVQAVRVQLQCDAENRISAGAIQKLGATHEGTLRQSGFRSDGSLRDTMVFSILPSEWPAIEAKLLQRMQILSQ
ncbi:MAG: GNAT family protein [Fimbriimonadaceae bacterium]|nr:GNAT family protein [Fimbriimonadaceae bacterium]